MMLQRLLLCFVGICCNLCPLIVQAQDKQPNYAPQLAPLFEKGYLKVAMYQRDTPPFYFVDETGKLTGIDVELLRGFAQQLGLRVEFDRSAKTIIGAINMVDNGQADLAICKLSITMDRARRVLFTQPYIKLRKALLVNRVLLQQQRNGRSKQETIMNLQGTIGVLGNTAYKKYAKQRFKHAQIKEYPSWKEAVEAVRQQQIIAAFRDEAEIKKVILDNKDDAVKLLTVVLEEDYDPKGIALPDNAQYLRFLLEFYIQSLGLELSANRVLFDYQDVIDTIHRNNQ